MHILITAIAFIFMLGLIVLVHEFGHFITAKKFGVYVHEFSIGMGPTLWSKQGKETKYSLRAIPIGGYVSMAGEDVNSDIEKDKNIEENRKFYTKKYYQKVIILIAGVAMNFILAIFIYSGLLMSEGSYYEPIPATISAIREDSNAEQVGILPGDVVINITKEDGSSSVISDFYDISLFTYDITNESLIYTIDRNGEILDFKVTPKYYEEEDDWLIGLQFETDKEHTVTWYNSLYYGGKYAKDNFQQMIRSFKLLLQPKGYEMVSGPVGIVSITSQSVEYGLFSYLTLIALINLNIGLVNLLPLPILDGGQIVFITISKLMKKELPERIKSAIMVGSWALILMLMVVITYKDLMNLI